MARELSGDMGRRRRGALARLLAGSRTLIRFSLSSTAHSMVTMLCSLLVLRWVPPEQMGVWQSMLLIQSYAAFMKAGLFNGLARELPFRLGAGDDSAQELVSAAQAVTVWMALSLCALAGLALLLPIEPPGRYLLPVVLLCTAVGHYEQFLAVTYRADRAFEELALVRVVQTAATVLTLPLVYVLGFAGVPLRYGLLTLLGAAMTHRLRPIRVQSRFSWPRLVAMMKVGAPIFGFAYLISVSGTFPRLLLLTERGTEEVGLFAPATAALAVFTMLPRSIGHYVGPQLTHRLGRTGDPRAMWPLAWRSATVVFLVCAPIAAVGAVLLPVIVPMVLPRYEASVPALTWTMIAGVFMGASLSRGAIKSAKAWRWMALDSGFQVAASFGVPYLLLRIMEDPLQAVGVGFAVAQASCFVVQLLGVYVVTHSRTYWEATQRELGRDLPEAR